MVTLRTPVMRDRWAIGGVVWVGVALLVGVVSALVGDDGGSATLWLVLAGGAVGLVFAIRASSVAVLVAAVLVGQELRDPSPWGTWAVAGGLLFLFALRRPRFDAVTAGIVVTAAAMGTAYSPLDDAGGGAFGLVALAVAAVGVGQWVQAQRRYVIAEVGRRRQETERRREEVARHVAEDRLRIARELHDSVAHHLAVVSVHTNVARANLYRSPPVAEQALNDVQDATQSVLAELGAVLGVLRGSEATVATPAPGGENMIDELLLSFRGIGLHITTEGLQHLTSLAPAARSAAQRLFEEGLTNAQRYGDGSVSLIVDNPSDGYVRISLRNRRGEANTGSSGSGLGLRGMEERVHLLGGTFAAGPDADSFLVTARLPAIAPTTAAEADV
ncbi:sensor histidine kinase [Aeromicrobium wangtongii]|uniref:sensor histidine kinase n=1 Tax=Aeromicrobium wangtongii TaxID=2969247 RepID=UPI002017EDFA|nr:histidine kinase [Aeromicrobium wangtongii]MCL3819372.1 histidine kinase [Aeromicrobium wangtongii]